MFLAKAGTPLFVLSLIQSPQEVREIAVARFRCRRFERAAESGHDAGMGGWNVDLDDPAIESVQFRFRTDVVLQLHYLRKRASGVGSFVTRGFAAIRRR